jgi:DSBA-like thioredoxin domain
MSLTVEVISDVICPWCYIGKRRLEKAVAAFDGPVKVRWLPFQLNPTMPEEGVSRREYRTKKFGSWERSQELDARVVAVGKGEGIEFAFDRIERTPNTLDAYRLIWLAEKQAGCARCGRGGAVPGLLHRGPGHQQSSDAPRRGCGGGPRPAPGRGRAGQRRWPGSDQGRRRTGPAVSGGRRALRRHLRHGNAEPMHLATHLLVQASQQLWVRYKGTTVAC